MNKVGKKDETSRRMTLEWRSERRKSLEGMLQRILSLFVCRIVCNVCGVWICSLIGCVPTQYRIVAKTWHGSDSGLLFEPI